VEEYWHIGDTQTRLRKVVDLRVREEKVKAIRNGTNRMLSVRTDVHRGAALIIGG
jgi:hypothetical protein